MPDEVHKGHRLRLKDRFLAEGLSNFQAHEILELLLFFGIQRKDTNALSHELIARYGSFSEVLDAPYEELLREKNMTENAAILLKLIPSISQAYLLDQQAPHPVLDSTSALAAYIVDFFVGETREVVYLLTLDSSLNAIACDRISQGTVGATSIAIRAIVSNALQHNAVQVVLAHNHPRGIAHPSNSDVCTTRILYDGLKLLDIRMIDHIIVSKGDTVSIRQLFPEIFE